MPETTEHRQLEIEKILTSIDLNRRVVLNTPQLLIGPQYLTEFNLTMGLIVSKPLPAIEALRDLVVGINMIQHNRTLNSPMPQRVKNFIMEFTKQAGEREQDSKEADY